VQISTVRRVLREAPGGDHSIETMPRRVPPRVDSQREAAPTEHSVTTTSPRTKVPRDNRIKAGVTKPRSVSQKRHKSQLATRWFVAKTACASKSCRDARALAVAPAASRGRWRVAVKARNPLACR
jgi:hypothetical protein